MKQARDEQQWGVATTLIAEGEKGRGGIRARAGTLARKELCRAASHSQRAPSKAGTGRGLSPPPAPWPLASASSGLSSSFSVGKGARGLQALPLEYREEQGKREIDLPAERQMPVWRSRS